MISRVISDDLVYSDRIHLLRGYDLEYSLFNFGAENQIMSISVHQDILDNICVPLEMFEITRVFLTNEVK